MLNVRLAGDHLYWKLLFTWMPLVMSLMVSFCAVPFPTRYLGLDLGSIWSVSEGVPTYFYFNYIYYIIYIPYGIHRLINAWR